jgi:sugar fermentation stimulation protein A
MRFASPLIRGTLLRRYKRFLADVMLEDGREVTVHCANPGAMLGLNAPGLAVWCEPNDAPGRKLGHAWRLVELDGGHFAGIDASLPNRLVAEALAEARIPALAGYATVRPEVRYGTRSRVDFLLAGPGRPDAYVEVKNVHLRRDADWAEFPDSVTARGARHLRELGLVAAAGHRAVMLYVVQRTDCTRLRLAADIDPAYAAAAAEARAAGVEVLAHATRITPDGVWLDAPLPVADAAGSCPPPATGEGP